MHLAINESPKGIGFSCRRRGEASCQLRALIPPLRHATPRQPLHRPSIACFTDCLHWLCPLQEIDVDITALACADRVLHRLCKWIGGVAVANRSTLRSLRLSGPLHLAPVFHAMAPFAPQFLQLEVLQGFAWQGQRSEPNSVG